VTFIKVRAHSGNIWHNRADRLACLAREEKEKEKESNIEKELVAEN
jgi:hypothetical protein